MIQYQKFSGSKSLVNRLASQVGSRDMAIKLLIQRGHMYPDGKTLTEEGERRNSMTASERAIDRAVKARGGSPFGYMYNEMTNKAVKRHG